MAETTEEVTYEVLDGLIDTDPIRLRDVAWAEIARLRNALTVCSQDQHYELHDGPWEKCQTTGCRVDREALGWDGIGGPVEGQAEGGSHA